MKSIFMASEKIQENTVWQRAIKLITGEYKRYSLAQVINMTKYFLLPSGNPVKMASWNYYGHRNYGIIMAIEINECCLESVSCRKKMKSFFLEIINLASQTIQINSNFILSKIFFKRGVKS